MDPYSQGLRWVLRKSLRRERPNQWTARDWIDISWTHGGIRPWCQWWLLPDHPSEINVDTIVQSDRYTRIRTSSDIYIGSLLVTPGSNWPAQIAKFMGPTWGPPGSCRPQMSPMLAPWILLSGWWWWVGVTGRSMSWQIIATWFERHVVSNHWQLDGLFNSFLQLVTK